MDSVFSTPQRRIRPALAEPPPIRRARMASAILMEPIDLMELLREEVRTPPRRSPPGGSPGR